MLSLRKFECNEVLEYTAYAVTVCKSTLYLMITRYLFNDKHVTYLVISTLPYKHVTYLMINTLRI
jgi:hypothetical protein